MSSVALAVLTPATAGAAPTHSPAPTHAPVQIPRVSTPTTPGYWLVDPGGHVAAGGSVPFSGSPAPRSWTAAVVTMAPTPDAKGYWLAASDAEVQAVGDAVVYGQAPPTLNDPVVGMASTPDGRGYWLVASDGGVFSFGDAHFHGSTGALRLNRPIIGMASTPDGGGYWLMASDGGIFTFGDAQFYGSTGNTSLSAPVVGAAVTPDGAGYWLATAAGKVYGFGDATVHTTAAVVPGVATRAGTHATTAAPGSSTVVGLAATSDGGGYWLASADGAVTGFGDAGLGGGSAAPVPSGSVVAVAAPGPPPVATRAEQWALAQVGKPYVYGGTGPNGFDCSGLVMAAYASTGIRLPRVAQDQYEAGPLLPAGANLEPGDIVFFGTASSITHDGIYVGDGSMVDAPHTGATVRVETYQWTDFVGATRPASAPGAATTSVTTGRH